MNYHYKRTISFLFLSFILVLSLFGQKTEIFNLKTEFQSNPIGLSERQPRFSWEFESPLKNIKQESFQVKVASSPDLLDNPDIWVSDILESNHNIIGYPGIEDTNQKQLQSFQKYYWNVSAWVDVNGKKQKIESGISSFETGPFHKDDWQAQWITDLHDKEFEPAPLFRKVFKTNKYPVKYARAYISGIGYYELFINNERIGNSLLDPGYTNYNKRVLYAAHDVTKQVQNNQENTIAIVLGHGWFNEQRMAWWNSNKAPWRARPQLLCEIHITYEDGSEEIVTSDETWKTSSEGPYLFNNLYVGDYFDNRLNDPRWKDASFDDATWDNASIVSSPAPVIENQQMPPIRISKTVLPVSMTKLSPNKYVFDMGENFSGFSKIKVKGEKGTRIKIRYSELLGDNGEIDQGNIDNYYSPVDNHPTMLTDVFILKGGGNYETFQPTFTYRGFQYVQVDSDTPIQLKKDDLEAYFLHTDVSPVGKFNCSDTTLNKIWKATNQSYLSNLHSIPTDCPSREKNGWTADVYLAIDAGLLNYDGILTYEKWMKDLLDSQNEKGQIPGIAPTSGFGYEDRIGPVWDAAMFIVPNAVYNYYGDTSIIANAYESMEKYLAYLETREKDGLLTFGYNDRNFWHTRTPTEYTSTLFYYFDVMLMVKFSKLLNKNASKYEKKAETLKKTINDNFYDSETYTYSNGSQTAQALALYLGIAPEQDEQKIAETIAQSIRDNFNHLDFGLLGAITVPRVLTKWGYGDLVHQMIIKPTPPSWGYWVNTLNRSTLQESWIQNFRRAYGGSLNHVFFGDISAWMYNYLAGINFDPDKPGFEHVIIKPYFLSDIDWVHGEYKSVRGNIVSKWNRDKDMIILEVDIPANTSATIYFNEREYTVGSGSYKYSMKL